MLTVNLDNQLKYMYSLERFGIKLGLEVMEALLAELGNPHRRFASIHITGTNGKGSTAAMLESVLRTAGHTTALYTSPHLFAFNERIKIHNVPISDQELGQLIAEVKAAAERARVTPTFFEFTTAIAFVYFAKHKPDIAIIEVGMGGLLDATNVITPCVSVITNIDLDHTSLLGKTKAAIAATKAGIIKPGIPTVTSESDPAIIHYLTGVCQELSSRLRIVKRDVAIESLTHTYQGQTFTAVTQGNPKTEYALALLGRHQLSNAGAALLVLRELQKQGMEVPIGAIKRGLAATEWPGRLQVVSEQPFILVDGAHNPQSLEALAAFLRDPATRPPSYDVLVVGMKNDKDISVLRDTVAPLFSHIITTEGSWEPMPAPKLAVALRGRPNEVAFGRSVEAITDPRSAAARGVELIGKTGALVITGSLYMIPSALTYLQEAAPN